MVIINYNIMANYAQAKVYKIIGPHDDNDCYVGSTIQRLDDRSSGHKQDYRRWKSQQSKKFMSSFNIYDKYGVNNCRIIVIEKCEVTSRNELFQREQYYIKTLECVNKNNAYTSTEEAKEQAKQYRAKPEYKEQAKQYRAKPEAIESKRISSKVYRGAHKQVQVRRIDPITGILHITMYECDGVTLARKKGLIYKS